MSTYLVTTAADVTNASDGVLSLREALDLAMQPGDRIEFATGLAEAVLTISTTLVIDNVAGGVTIDGDIDNDGDADITLSASNATIFRVETSAKATFEYLKFSGTVYGDEEQVPANGEDGNNGSIGSPGTSGGGTGGTGVAGQDGGDGEDGGDGADVVGAILNYGTAIVRYADFREFNVIGEAGEHGGHGGQGGYGGTGGGGGTGTSGATGGRGGTGGVGGRGGNGGDGGEGGDGGNAAIIANHGTMTIGFTTFTASNIVSAGRAGDGGWAGQGGTGGMAGGGGRGGTASAASVGGPGGDAGAFGQLGTPGIAGDGGDAGDAAMILHGPTGTLTFDGWTLFNGVEAGSGAGGEGGYAGGAGYEIYAASGGPGGNGLLGGAGEGNSTNPPTNTLLGDPGWDGDGGVSSDTTLRLGPGNILIGANRQVEGTLFYIAPGPIVVTETGDGGTTDLVVQVNRFGPVEEATVTLTIYHPSNSHSFAAAQFSDGVKPTTVTVNFAAGARTATHTFSTLNDSFTNGDRFFDVAITGASAGANFWNTGTTRIVREDDDRGGAAADVLSGSPYDDTMAGLGADDTLSGELGNDTLDGGIGTDTLIGGPGDDTYINPTGDIINEVAGAAGGLHDLVLSDSSYSLANSPNVEDLTLTGTAKINGIGNTLNNRITGNDNANILNGGGGNDFLAGMGGADTLQGGPGNDIYLNPVNGTDTIVEAAGAAGGLHDRIQTLYSFNLSTVANVEDITLVGAANANALGNNLANILVGNPGNNIINGSGGNDTITGAGGDDTMNGGAGADLFKFAAAGTGTDTIGGFSAAQDRFDLSGGGFSARVEGGGNTTLTHAGGTIVMTGVTGLSLAAWNALVVGGAREAHARPALFHDHPAPHVPAAFGHSGHADFLYA